MKYAIKVEIYPTEEQGKILDGQSRICNWLYNHLLEIANEFRKEYKETQSNEVAKVLYTERGLRDLIPELKKEYPFLKTVHSKPLKNAALRLSESIQDYQKSRKGKRKGKKTGWPKYRKWKEDWFSLKYCEPWNGYKIEGNKLILSLGKDERGKQLQLSILIKEKEALKDKKVKTLEIVKEYGKYYACFVVEVESKKKKRIEKVIAIDPNHKNIGYGVDTTGVGIEIKDVKRIIKRSEAKIDYLKGRRDRCEKKSKKVELENGSYYWLPSRRWIQFDKALQKAYQKKREQTKQLMYALANKLYKNYDLVMIGDYTPQPGTGISRGMRRAMNNGSFIGEFKKILSFVAEKSGKHFFEYKEYNTTKECNKCHYLNKDLTLEERSWICPVCKTYHLRDENSAINGLKQNFMSCSDLFEVTQRCAWEWNFSNWMLLPKELNDGRGSSSAKAVGRFVHI